MQPIYTFSDSDRSTLQQSLLAVAIDPYKDYDRFRDAIAALIDSGDVPQGFVDALARIRRERDEKITYAHLISNNPVDDEIPWLDQDDALEDKYRKKLTFVGEGLLELQSQYLGSPLLAYATRNNGDFFQDVYADNRFSNTQTQKTDGELYWHNERTAHPVRADFISLLGLRTPETDLVYTKYVDGREILRFISSENQALLREAVYITPFDELSRAQNKNQIVSDQHALLENEHSFRYYDTRTVPADPDDLPHLWALWQFRDALSKVSEQYHRIRDADLLIIANQDGLHSRQLVDVQDRDKTRFRWLLKTYSFRDAATADRHSDYWLDGVRGRVTD
ncbi:taurine catabolism dioxygenase TauD [Rathayibacter sp. AY1E3]|uniref:taurine catabolism dioxygenase TauD n=1 Tax=Rathayibacter sp. AY1E3 TaxID=2080551 RepID=UPI000CE79FF3|nr:taurine catabolism dioxygenase TauD [Rathayibacter sp. AY1E3]PPH38317.1 taurine catabolism dioxygenase TauD [Rathayibacter sp. AY1E3]